MPVTELALALLGTGALSGVAGAGVTGAVGWRLRRAQTEQITSQAHREIYAAYGALLGDLRTEIGSLREDLGAAERRADAAEAEATRLRGEVAELRRRLEQTERREQQVREQLARIDPTELLRRRT